MGVKEHTQEIQGMNELKNELKKMNADRTRNSWLAIASFVIAVVALIRTW